MTLVTKTIYRALNLQFLGDGAVNFDGMLPYSPLV